MNIEIANRLQQLRKEKGYSQEELAQALGLSRQAVSKWERAESSPDTDNLICLAKLYGMSLDELLNTDESVEEIRERTIEVEEEKAKEKENDDEYIRIHKGHLASRNDHDKEFIKVTKHPVFMIVSSSVVALISTVLFLVFGFAFDAWYECWLFFLFIPLIASFFEAVIEKHAFTAFAYPILVTMIYEFFLILKHIYQYYQR
ncbi:MAG: helix-turn-helix domain-containing protein [bacterium]|nr:helix-turn-helix domain-containing protein [bacterium]